MGRLLPTTTVVVLAVAALSRGQAATDSAALLTEARKALGGDKALAAVSAFTLDGTITPAISGLPGPPTGLLGRTMRWEIRCALPDKFVQDTRQDFAQGRTLDEVGESTGFNGQDPIRASFGPTGLTSGFAPETPKTPAALAARALNGKRLFAQFTFPLFAASFSVFPLDIGDSGRAKMGNRQLDVVNAKDADGRSWRLYLDSATHLPALLIWSARPLPMRPRMDLQGQRIIVGGPIEDVDPLEWRMEISDYAVANGLNWPRKLKATYNYSEGGHAPPGGGVPLHILEFKITRFAINPTIDPKWFSPSK